VQVRMHGSIGQIETHDPREGFELQTGLVKLIEATLLATADRVVTHSRANRVFWSELLDRDVAYEQPPFAVNPSEAVSASPAVRALAGNSPFGVVVARVQHWKGPITLCRALRALKAEAPRIIWVGRDTPFQRQSQSMSAWLAREYAEVWGHTIVPVGSLSYADVRALQRGAAFGVVPSLWDVYNFTCVELMAAGRVVLCSTGAGASDLIENGINGLTFPPDDSDELCSRLLELRAASDRSASIGAAARQTVIAKLRPSVIAEEYLASWTQLGQTSTVSPSVSDWISEFVQPHGPGARVSDLLDQLSLRQLAVYTLGRGFRKLAAVDHQ
jgi:glycosyltransferase involved in cell wall biosynthesis